MWVGIIFLVPGDINFVGSKLGIIQKKHLTNACTICDTVVEISICGQGLPMKATSIGPPIDNDDSTVFKSQIQFELP